MGMPSAAAAPLVRSVRRVAVTDMSLGRSSCSLLVVPRRSCVFTETSFRAGWSPVAAKASVQHVSNHNAVVTARATRHGSTVHVESFQLPAMCRVHHRPFTATKTPDFDFTASFYDRMLPYMPHIHGSDIHTVTASCRCS